MTAPYVLKHSMERLGPRTLRDLGAALIERARAMEQADPEPFVRRRRELSPEGIEELAQMVVDGQRPTIGWWRRRDAECGFALAAVDAGAMTSETTTSALVAAGEDPF